MWTALFGAVPFVSAFFPTLGGRPVYQTQVAGDLPRSIPTISVQTLNGPSRYVALAENSVLWEAHRGAIEFHGWAPVAGDPTLAAFARILLAPAGAASEAMVREAAAEISANLQERGVQSIPLADGLGGMALWIPFSDKPPYPPIRAWLHAIANEAERRNPTLFCAERPLAERGNRVHIAVESNAPGRFSALPYSLRGFDGLPMVTPITWGELETVVSGDVTAANFHERYAQRGDVFATVAAAIRQPSATIIASADAPQVTLLVSTDIEPHGRIISASIEILSDGRPRDADQLLAEGLRRGLMPKTTTRKYVYTALIEYIARARGHDRKPLIVQDPDRHFRINHEADDWPAPRSLPAQREPLANVDALTHRLRETAHGGEPEAFELAVCDAFTALGFVAHHVGGGTAPDGYIDAPLGALGYRVMLECKTASRVVGEPDAVEASKYRDAYHAQYAILVGPAFGAEVAFASELQTHHVAAFTVNDLAKLLEAASDPAELRPLFEQGLASDRIGDLLWNRQHGVAKRVAVVTEIIAERGWRQQLLAAQTGDPSDAPSLTEDAAMMLIDQVLLDEQGSQQPCSRDQVRAAFAYLVSPLVNRAFWSSISPSAIVVTRPA